MEKEKKEVTEQKAAMTIRYGKTLYKVIFRFAGKGKATMNDKVLKLIPATMITNTRSTRSSTIPIT